MWGKRMSGETSLRVSLQRYELQMVTARRLARYRAVLRARNNEAPPDPVARRKMMVERVARELYEMILFTGIENPVVEQIRKELSAKLGGEIRFTYPPGEEGLRVTRMADSGEVMLSREEQQLVMSRLWGAPLQAVDNSMV